jgi:hypothetical protein
VKNNSFGDATVAFLRENDTIENVLCHGHCVTDAMIANVSDIRNLHAFVSKLPRHDTTRITYVRVVVTARQPGPIPNSSLIRVLFR